MPRGTTDSLSARQIGTTASFGISRKMPARRAMRSGWRLSGTKCHQSLDGFLQFLGGAERDLLARLDLDRLAGRRVAAHACGALAHLQDAEAADADAVTFLEVLDDEVDHVVQDQLGGLLGELM